VVCVFRRKVMVPTEDYVKEHSGAQPGRPDPPQRPTDPQGARPRTPDPDRRPDRVRAGHPGAGRSVQAAEVGVGGLGGL